MKTCKRCEQTKSETEFASHHWCRACNKQYMAEYRKANRNAIQIRRAEYRESNREVLREDNRRRYWADREAQLDRMQAYRARRDPEVKKAYRRSWYETNKALVIGKKIADMKVNPAKYRAREREREARKFQATPGWANKFFMEEAYALAALRTKMLGFQWHVDHRVPLRSAKVCGLHVECNLQVIPGADNIRKGNRHWPDMPV